MEKYPTKKIREVYRSKLPTNSFVEIARMANVSQPLVSSWFSGKSNNVQIEYAILRYISKIRKEREELLIEAGLEDLLK